MVLLGIQNNAFGGTFLRDGVHLGAPCFKSAAGKMLFKYGHKWCAVPAMPGCGARHAERTCGSAFAPSHASKAHAVPHEHNTGDHAIILRTCLRHVLL